MHVQRAEFAREASLRFGRQVLIGEEEHQPVVERIAESLRHLGGERLGKIETLDCGADRRRQRTERERSVADGHAGLRF